LFRSEEHVLADGECLCIDGLGCYSRNPVEVHAHLAEVMTEARLKKRSRSWIQWLISRESMVGDSVCLLLVRISRSINLRLRL
jgi:hypothetical protein